MTKHYKLKNKKEKKLNNKKHIKKIKEAKEYIRRYPLKN
jgi:hypothetical protein